MDRRLIAAIVIVPVLGGIGFFLSKRSAAGGGAGQIQYKLAKVDTGEVKKTVSATGTLQAWRVVDIKARAGGELAYLGVDVGSDVKPGQVLARIDPLDVQLTLNNARADETSAKAREAQSSKTYQLQVKQSVISVADAQASLSSALANAQSAAANVQVATSRLLTARQQAEAQPNLTQASIASAKANYEQALTNRRQLDATLRQQRAAAKAAADQAAANQTNARLSLERQNALLAKGFVSQQAVDTASANLEVANANLFSAKTKVDTIEDELKSTVEAADARVAQTKAAYEQAQAGAVDVQRSNNSAKEAEASLTQARAALRQSEAAVARARVALDQARANGMNNDIRHFDITANQATIARAAANRLNAETSLARTIIRAPMAGVVLEKSVEQGTIIASAMGMAAQGTTILKMGDTSRMYVDVTVDETDIAQVENGQKVDVTVEAYPGMPFEGKVIRIDPQAVVLQNVTSIHVRVEVDNSAVTFQMLKPGMNATCEFVLKKKNDVLRVPNEAIRQDNDGDYVDVASGGKPAPPDPKTGQPADDGALVEVKTTKVRIKQGVVGNDTTEIEDSGTTKKDEQFSGTKLKEGDQIVAQTIEPVAATPGGSPFGGGMGRPGGGMGGGRR